MGADVRVFLRARRTTNAPHQKPYARPRSVGKEARSEELALRVL